MTTPSGPSAAGAARFSLGGNGFGSTVDHDTSMAVLDAYLAAGGTLIDTALVYSDWIAGIERSCSEKTIGRWLAERRPAGVTVATKGGHPDLDRPTQPRLDRDSLLADARRSREHLGLDVLPLYYVHRDDPARPVADILQSLEELRAEGLIDRYAASNWTASRLREAAAACRSHGWSGFAAHQVSFSIAVPAPGSMAPDLTVLDAALVAAHAELGIPTVAYSSQAVGYFDKAVSGAEVPARYDTPDNQQVGAELAPLAARYGLARTQLALAALLAADPPVLPVVGCRTLGQLAAAVEAAEVQLEPDDVAVLQRLVVRALG